ncbi:hypothetical protein [Marinobacterium lutimaris]|uniref:Uncharacterized protein n=1 Tax=Marinobacterium lutimaris TaxID=568106 RepID=A0A1H5YRG0_9GAMM|nr:hypothetical protein [Marinobacterium lutimaris]SEG26693.1 hypothetical protein SAMN05444390_1011865 [Marinobacterium lutimaris]
MKALTSRENSEQALDQFADLSSGGFGRGIARVAMLMAAGRYCRHRHLSIGRQSIFQRKLMENHDEC